MTSGANMASAAENAPNRNGPLCAEALPRLPHDFAEARHVAAHRLARDRAPHISCRDSSGKPSAVPKSPNAFRPPPSAPWRGLSDPAARPARRCASPRYSMIARLSHTVTSPSIRIGTLPAGECFGTARLRIRKIERDQDLVEGDSELLHQQPRTQRPGRIELVGDDKVGIDRNGFPLPQGAITLRFPPTPASCPSRRSRSRYRWPVSPR